MQRPDREQLTVWGLVAGTGALFAVIIAVLVSTYEPPLKEGRVVDKDFTPAHYEEYTATYYRTEIYTDLETQCSGGYNGEPQTCRSVPVTKTRQVPYYVQEERWVEDDYDIEIRGCKTDDDGKEKCRTSHIDVSRSTYNQCKLGSLYREETKCLPQ